MSVIIIVDCQPGCLFDPKGSTLPRGATVLVVDDRGDRSFEELVQDALDALPDDVRGRLSNVAVVTEDEPPPGQPLLGLYQGVPLTRRTSYYAGALPDKITIFRGPLERLYGADPERLRREVKRVVLHEIAHHFGISDDRLVELDRY
jgi:predicted Zn-dependent protease with MMP-like domain